ncbi:conserved hypothetical protein [Leishmania major strain Friedlin]|uniref:Uncharacterized protein n=1 Tax=Leishmania major TaxID=5664 RepID=Q4Q2N4_LEIMA|nr:conserved hypothetical protein [Leishmania major strain Friedlin]CAG9582187.1 Tripartite_attachment_complex_40/TAC40 [Leishmania major strain Friedlin]CAJ08031.1 conserved hypothetical protein [Leishmania major strain Friedlin]|eukprot:XP_001686414.1 conserved hypothetical protein [Leishmania major strain Friedlin]
MEAPSTLNNYLSLVDDFFRKTFRDEMCLFVALKSRQYSESILGVNMFAKNAASVSADAPPAAAMESASKLAAADVLSAADKPPTYVSNFLSISPRMALHRDGRADGKMKVAYEFSVPRVCRLQQALTLNSRGAVTVVGSVKDLIEGLTAGVRASVNTLMPASEDVTVGHVHYQRGDKYSSLRYQRNGLGSSNLLLDCGITFFNLLLGAGFERRQLSFLEHKEGSGQLDVMYVGAGFTGVNWSVATKIVRLNDAWSNARLTMLQRLSSTTAVACQYNFDLIDTVAKVSLGFTQGIQLRVPMFIHTKSSAPVSASASRASPSSPSSLQMDGSAVATIPAWSTPLPLLLAAKAESDGNCSATLRGLFSNSIRWGIVMHTNLLEDKPLVKYGLTLSMEYES